MSGTNFAGTEHCWRKTCAFEWADCWSCKNFIAQLPTTKVLRTDLEFLVLVALKHSEITQSKGAELLDMGLFEFREWWNARVKEDPEMIPRGET